MFTILGSGCDLTKLNTISAHKARPFVSPMVWAVFRAYTTIAMGAAIRIEGLKSGIATDLVNHGSIKKLVKAALPHQSEYLDKFGEAGYHYLLDELEEKLLREINVMLSGKEADQANVDQVAQIIGLCNEIDGALNAKRAKG